MFSLTPSPRLKRRFVHLAQTLLLVLLSIWRYLTTPSQRKLLRARLASAKTYEEWHAAATELDNLLGNNIWRQDPASKHYDANLIATRLTHIRESRSLPAAAQIATLHSGLLRNVGNILCPHLYSRSYVGNTKVLINDYIDTTVETLTHIASLPPTPTFTLQHRRDFIAATRQSYGRTALMLHGGAAFGLCHLGVVKALHAAQLLPRIIAGTGVGALIAALVCTHPDSLLPPLLSGAAIDLSAFPTTPGSWKRKLSRLRTTGHLLDLAVLESCVRANVGDLTFADAYASTNRILCITVGTLVLNHLTAPHVLIWSAACASNAPSPLFGATPTLLARDHGGEITPWIPATAGPGGSSPYSRLGELFGVNFIILSQARPYLAPFLHSDLHRHDRRGVYLKTLRLLGMEARHIVRQLDTLGLLPLKLRGWLLGEIVEPGAGITVVPALRITDFEMLLANPTNETVRYWVGKGERGIWGALEMVRAALAVEVEVERIYWMVREGEAVKRGREVVKQGGGREAVKQGGEKAGEPKVGEKVGEKVGQKVAGDQGRGVVSRAVVVGRRRGVSG